jgi:methionine aminopeptidase type I
MFLKTVDEEKALREAGRVNAVIHHAIRTAMKPGISTLQLNEIAEELLHRFGAASSFQSTTTFPGHICVSVNDEIGHGIPNQRRLQAGDLVKIDVGVAYDGMHSDCARTHIVGTGSPEAKRLLGVTKLALERGIRAAQIHARTSDISYAVWQTVQLAGFDVIRHAFGHGIGRHLHEDPQIASFGPPGLGPVLAPHMALAIEPVVVSRDRTVRKRTDGWTEYTADGGLSAHFEDTVLLLPSGPEIVTR